MATQRWINRPVGSNWGDFGPDDELGRLNLLTPERVRAAVAEVKAGKTFCLSLPLDLPAGNHGKAMRMPPKLFATHEDGVPVYNMSGSHSKNWKSTGVVCDDAALLYLYYSTHWDGFSHLGAEFDADGDGVAEIVYYNGWRGGDDIVSPTYNAAAEPWAQFENPKAKKLGVDSLAMGCLQGRGVLVNLYSRYGRTRHPVTAQDLQRILDEDGITIEAGDILCLYTGFDQVILDMNGIPDDKVLRGNCAGLDSCDPALLQWITDSNITAIMSDNRAIELLPARCIDQTGVSAPLHNHCLFKLGIPLGELLYLSELVEWLTANKRHSFLITAPPLRLPGAVGSPITPIATV